MKMHELENNYKKLSKKLPAKLDDIFEPTFKIHIGINEIVACCDLGASVSTIPKSLFERLNLGSLEIPELKLHLVDSTYKQVVGIKQNVSLQIKGCLTRVNSTNVLNEGLRIGEIGRRMNSKVRLVEISVYRK
jgi:hypothetical protein